MTNRKVIYAPTAAAVLTASQGYTAHPGLGMAGTAGLSGLGSFRDSGVSNGRMYLNNGGSDPFSSPVSSGTSATSTTTGGAGTAGLPPLT
jgi:hypothetical protein